MKLSTFSRFFANLGLGRSERKPQRRAKRRPVTKPSLEFLEDRTLLSTTPAAVVTNPNTSPYFATKGFAPSTGFDPQIVMDPLNSQNLVEVNVNTTNAAGASLIGATSTDGGQSWKTFTFANGARDTGNNRIPGTVYDPTTFNNGFGFQNEIPYTVIASPSVSFDRNENFYVVSNQYNAGATNGAIVFDMFSFSGGAPVENFNTLTTVNKVGGPVTTTTFTSSTNSTTVSNQVLYQWNNQDPAYNPTVAVDTNLPAVFTPATGAIAPSFTDPTTGATQTDSMAVSIDPTTGLIATSTTLNPVPKGIYVGWNNNFTYPGGGTISRIMIDASGDGGNNFTTNQYADPTGVSIHGAAPTLVGSAPQILFTQGSPVVGAATPTVPGGQLNIVYTNDTGAAPIQQSQPDGALATNDVAAAATFQGTTGGIRDALPSGASATESWTLDMPAGAPIGTTTLVVHHVAGQSPPPNGSTIKFPGDGTTYTLTGSTVGVTDDTWAITPGLTAAEVNGATVQWTPPTSNVSRPQTTQYTVNVTATAFPTDFTSIDDLEVTLNLVHPHLNQISIVLVPPIPAVGGASTLTPITLLSNLTNPDGSNTNLVGLNGANMGVIDIGPGNFTHNVGTVFDDDAPRNITDGSAATPWIGHFQPSDLNGPVSGTITIPTTVAPGGTLDSGVVANGDLSEVDGFNIQLPTGMAQITGTWTLEITDYVNDGDPPGPAPRQFLNNWSMHFTSLISTTGFGANADNGPAPGVTGAAGDGQPHYTDPTTGGTVGTRANDATEGVPLPGALAGSPSNVYATHLGSGASGTPGTGPGIVAAFDNTLGSFSPYQSRFYLAYSTGTNILLTHSDLDGVDTSIFNDTWNNGGLNPSPVQVNDDTIKDNFSEGNRPEFMPSIAVDSVTGTVVVSYYDGRWDAATARVGNSISYSVNGGANWSTSASMNLEQTATDAITGNTVNVSPVLGNQTAAGTLGFGDRAGLVVYDGDVIPFFGSNLNIAGSQIMTATVTIPSGPTVVGGDMGPVVNDFNFTPTVYADGSWGISTYGGANPYGTYAPITYNSVFNTDGTRELNKFVVTFDRPIDISTFTPDLIQVYFRDTAGDPAVQIPVQSITALDNNTRFGPDQVGLLTLATQFLITLATPQFLVGTYSYAIGLSEWSLVGNGSNGAGGISATDTTLTVKTGGLIPPTGPFTVTLDQEQLRVTSTSGNTWTVLRGWGGTTAAPHVTNENIITIPLSTDIRSIATSVSLNNHAGLTENWVLAAPVAAGDATLMVTANGPPAPTTPFMITIGQEILTVTGTSGVGNTTWNITRGVGGSAAAAHVAGATINYSAVLSTETANLDMPPTGAFAGATVLTVHHNAVQSPPAAGATITFNDGFQYTILSTAQGPADDTWTLTSGLVIGEANGATVTYTTGTPVLLGNFMNQNENAFTNTKQTEQAPGVNTTTANTNSTPVPLPGSGAGTTTPSPIITFTDPYQQVRQDFYDPIQVRLDVAVDTSITSSITLSVELVSPNGTTIDLGPVTFAETNNGLRTIIFADYLPAAAPIGVVFHKSLTPLLAALVNENANGGWQLLVTNSNTGPSGDPALVSLQDWSLSLPLTTNLFAVPNPVNGVPFQFPYSNQTLPFIIPGPHVVSTAVVATGTNTTATAAYNTITNVYDQWTLTNTISFTANSLTVNVGGPALPPAPFTIMIDKEQMVVSPTSNTVWTILQRNANGAGAVPHGAGAVITYSPNVTVPFGTSTTTTQLTLPVTDAFQVQQNGTNHIQVAVNLKLATPQTLLLQLVAQDGTTVTLFNGLVTPVAGVASFTFDDFAPTGTIAPLTPLAALVGENTAGDWRLAVTNSSGAGSVTVTSWTLQLPHTTADNEVLNGTASGLLVTFDRDMLPGTFSGANVLQMVGPLGLITGPFTVIADPAGTPLKLAKRVFEVVFPTPQALNGTYTLSLAPSVTDTFGNAVDTNLNAGIDILNGTNATKTVTTVLAPGTVGALNLSLPPGSTVTSTIPVSQAFAILQDSASGHHIQVTINANIANSSDLQAQLIAPDGTVIQLFTNVAQGVANPSPSGFIGTVFDDFATQAIQNGFPPFSSVNSGDYNPQQPLSVLVGKSTLGTWQLVLTNTSASDVGTLNLWSLAFPHAAPDNNLGEPIIDQISAGFRIFTQDPNNLLSQQQWTAVGPAADNNGANTGPVNAIAVDKSDPSGNTVFVAAASGGLWKTTNFLTTNPSGPTYIPLTNLGPTGSLNISSIAIYTGLIPTQSVLYVMTGNPNNTNPAIPGNIGFPQTLTAPEIGNPVDLTAGIGLLQSVDGGQSWRVLDSSHNFYNPTNDGGNHSLDGTLLPENSPNRDHLFVGLVGYKVVVDPTALPSSYPVLYAAFSQGANNTKNGLYRSLDGGADWVVMPSFDPITKTNDLFTGTATPIQVGNATDVVLAAGSADANGNLQQLYAAFQGQGVYGTTSATATTTLALLAGGQGDPSRQNVDGPTPTTVGVSNPASTPNGNNGLIVLATPTLTSSPLENSFYENWLYAAVSNVGGSGLVGLYVSKDFGRNWTMIQLPEVTGAVPVYGTNNFSRAKINTLADPNALDDQITGITSLSLTVDPTNPNIVYLGGAGYNLLRIDISNLADAYAAVPYTNIAPDGGTVQFSSTGPASVNNPGARFGIYNVFTPNTPLTNPPTYPLEQGPTGSTGWDNLLRDPLNPFANPSTLQVTNYNNFNNQGTGVLWGELDNLTNSAGDGILGNLPDPIFGNAAATLTSAIDIRTLVAIRDPLTGETRLLIGSDNGVFTGAVQTSTALQDNVGTAQEVIGSRNGNLQLADMADSAAQPSSLAASIAGALFYGSSQFNNGFPQSSASILDNGVLNWTGENIYPSANAPSYLGNGTSVATDPTGTGQLYQDRWAKLQGLYDNAINQQPFVYTDFFLVTPPNGQLTSRTLGLDASNQGAWPSQGGSRFAVNPIDPTGLIMSSQTGVLWRSTGVPAGHFWQQITTGGFTLGGYGNALAFGAPDPSFDTNVNDFIYAGTVGGQVWVTRTGGGGAGSWTSLVGPAGKQLDGSAIEQIVTDPRQGSHDLYAVTQKGVYYMADSTGVTTPIAWTNITGALFSLTRPVFNNPLDQAVALTDLTSIAVDWRFAVPTDPSNPNSPLFPVLYVAGNGGVFRSQNEGATWTVYPAVAEAWTLASPISATATTLTVSANGPTPPSGPFAITIGQEQLTVTATAGNIWTVTRHVGGTTAAAYNAGATVTYSGDGAQQQGGFLPSMNVTSLQLMTGNINTTNGSGLPDESTGFNMLMASTYGQGDFVIRLDNAAVQKYSLVSFSALQVTSVAAVTSNPTTMIGVKVTFNGVVDPASVTAGDITIIDPNGNQVVVTSVTDVTPPPGPGTGNKHNVYQFTFLKSQTAVGIYSIMLSNVTNNAGDKMTPYSGTLPFPYSVSEAVADFPVSAPGGGIYGYRPSTGFQQLLTVNASVLAINANGDVAAELPGYGVYRYTEATETWLQLTPANAALLAIDSAGNVYADLQQAGVGIYKFTSPTNYKQLTPADATVMAVDAGGDLVAVFKGYGVQELKNGTVSFVQIHPLDASQVAIDTAGDVFAEFPGYGVGKHPSGGSWTTLNGVDASLLAADAAGDLAVVFPGYGVYRDNGGVAGGFTQLSSNSSVSLLAMGGAGDVFAEYPGMGMWLAPGAINAFHRITLSSLSMPSQDPKGDAFGVLSGQGIWQYTLANGWQQLHPVTPSLMAVDTLGDVAAVFSGYGTYLYSHTTQTWKQLHPLSASLLSIDAAGDVFAEFSPYGVYEATFGSSNFNKQLSSANASLMAVDAAGDLFADFHGYGVQELKNGAGSFTALNGADASLLAVDAAGDVAAVFSGYGTFRLMAGASPASWQRLNTLGGSQLAIDGNADVYVQFSGYPGVYRYVSPSLFSQVTPATPLLLTDDLAGDIFMDFQSIGFYRYTFGLGFQLVSGTEGDANVLA